MQGAAARRLPVATSLRLNMLLPVAGSRATRLWRLSTTTSRWVLACGRYRTIAALPALKSAGAPLRRRLHADATLLLEIRLRPQVARIETAGLTVQQILEQVSSRAEEMDTMQVGLQSCFVFLLSCCCAAAGPSRQHAE